MSIGRLVAVAIVGSVCTASLGAQTHTTLHSFKNDQGLPIARPLEASDGKIYGTTFTGGSYGFGSVYVLTPDGLGGFTFSTLVSFTGGANGTCGPRRGSWRHLDRRSLDPGDRGRMRFEPPAVLPVELDAPRADGHLSGQDVRHPVETAADALLLD